MTTAGGNVRFRKRNVGFRKTTKLDIPYCHHERWDGRGYPRRLKGEEIPLAEGIFAVVDTWHALTSDRPYRKAWPVNEAAAYLRQQAGKQFEPRVMDAFMNLIQEE